MNLYIIRHGDAAPLGNDGMEDADRPLTDAGRAQAERLSRALQRLGVSLHVVVSSPLLRARQTAEEILRHWPETAPELKICDHLSPGRRLKKLVRWLVGHGEENVALVGHEPDLSTLVAWLMGSKRAQLKLTKGAIAAVACEGEPEKGGGTLLWLVTPRWMEVAADVAAGS